MKSGASPSRTNSATLPIITSVIATAIKITTATMSMIARRPSEKAAPHPPEAEIVFAAVSPLENTMDSWLPTADSGELHPVPPTPVQTAVATPSAVLVNTLTTRIENGDQLKAMR